MNDLVKDLSSDTSTHTQVLFRPVASLHLNPNNCRLHTKKQIAQIGDSIATFGFLVPILIDKNSTVICGHARLLAVQSQNMHEVPTIMVEHLSDAQIKAFMIADNKLTENGGWNEQLLGQQFKELIELNLDFDIGITGFEMGEIDMLIESVSIVEGEVADPDDETTEFTANKPVTKLGDIWTLGAHRILCGNALEEQSFSTLMQDKKAVLVFIDPPYNVKIDGHVCGNGVVQHREFAMASGEMSEAEFTTFLQTAVQRLVEHSSDGSIHYICMDFRHMRELLAAGNGIYSELKNLCVWVKDNGGMGTFYRSQHELIFVFKNGKASHKNNFELGQHGRYRTNVWEYPGINSLNSNSDEGNLAEMHPTVKPVSMVADAIMDCSDRGDIVLDSFLGSGTTLIAAERVGRRCRGIELDSLYVDTAIRRWQRLTGKEAIHVASGQTFNAIEAANV